MEELKAAYGTDYTIQAITLPKVVQKQPWYLKLNPNGKIPVIVDHDLGGIAVGESGGMSFPKSYLCGHWNSNVAKLIMSW